MYADFTMGELLVSAGLAGVIIWALDWRFGEHSQRNQEVKARTPNRWHIGRSQTVK
jgi:hypothetical protein